MSMSQLQSSPQQSPCALIADDDPGIRLTLSALLEQKGYSVVGVENGLEAVQAFSNHSVDIVLLDIRMPEMDGFSACRAIRELANGKSVPILMLTGQDDTESIKNAYEAGATDFVSKPINYVLLGFRIDYIVRGSDIAEELRKAQQRSNNAQRIADFGHIEWNPDHTIAHCSKGIRKILLLSENTEFASFDDFYGYVHPDDQERVKSSISSALEKGVALDLEHRVVRSDGSVRFILQISDHQKDLETPYRMIVTMQDVTDRVDTENRLHALAFYDHLTGLPNRSFLIQHLDQLLKTASRHEHITAVIVFGVDKFDKIVESLDHEVVEDFTRKIADRIKTTCRNSDLLTRQLTGENDEEISVNELTTAKLRNDEYVILLPEIRNLQAASSFLHRLKEKFEKAFQLQDAEVYVTTTAGISIAPIDGTTANQLLKFAEIAKGFASKKGPGNFRYFKQSLNDQVTRNSILANDLRKALKQEELKVHYQPKVSLLNNKIVGVEALSRWTHPTLGEISPVEFIPIAEEESLISQLGEWVLKTACDQVFEWNTELGYDLGVSVNISPEQFLDDQGMNRIVQYISDSPISNKLVELELTESTLLTNFEASLSILNQFRKLGCGLAIDDFGTGYSSLSYLGRLPAKVLKIDKSFIDLIESSNQYTAIVRGIINLAHSLSMTVIAEGVETDLQMAILAQESCDEVQGYIINPPLPAQSFVNWLKDWEARPMYSNPAQKVVGVIRQ
jgi:diguanylate cyclase (GGDEF)-like protein